MSVKTKAKIHYAIKEDPSRLYSMAVAPKAPYDKILELTSKNHNMKFIAIFVKDKEISKTDKSASKKSKKTIYQYYNENNDEIFIFSTDNTPPSPEFYDHIDTIKSISNSKSARQRLDTPKISSDSSINKTIIKEAKEAGIKTKKIKQPELSETKLTFYFTGGSKDDLLKGIEVELSPKMSPTKCREKLQEVLISKGIDMFNRKLLIYLPGGIPFLGGTLANIYDNEDKIDVKNVIYGVLTRNISDIKLGLPSGDPCNIKDPEHQILISPICDSSIRGLSDMACLMGYLFYRGQKSELLLRTCAAVIHFPPLIISMHKIMKGFNLVCRDIVTVCSTLFTFFRAYLADTIEDDKVFEYGLRFCNLISHIDDKLGILPIIKYKRQVKEKGEKEESGVIFTAYLGLDDKTYFWDGDSNQKYEWLDFSIDEKKSLNDAYEKIASFTPIAPLSVLSVSGCAIVKGKVHEYLYVAPSGDSNVTIVDPKIGMLDKRNIDKFAKDVNESEETYPAEDYIEPDQVKQIIMVNLDESKSMTGNLNGYFVDKTINNEDDIEKVQRMTIATQLLITITNKLYAYRIPCVQGLISFNYHISLRCPFTPIVPEFEKKGLENLDYSISTKLWDSLILSMREIEKFRKDDKGKEKYKNAISRILVISDGDDVDSKAKVQDVLIELIEKKIIVDSIVISGERDCGMLCAVSHATGGISYQVQDIQDALSFFEQSAFLNVEERVIIEKPLIEDEDDTVPSKLRPEHFTNDFMNKARDKALYDAKIINKTLQEASEKVKVSAPKIVVDEYKKDKLDNRIKRILKELKNSISLSDDISEYLKIFVYNNSIDKWKVFLKGPDDSPYENKWWYLFVTFPDLYPLQPPNIRFVSIPYHLNVSSDGKICIDCISRSYDSDISIVQIFKYIRQMLKNPNIELPIQTDLLLKYKMFPKKSEKQNESLRKKYYELARKSTKNNAIDDYNEFVQSDDDDDEDDDDDRESLSLVLSSSAKKDDELRGSLVKTTTGQFSREEFNRWVEDHRNPIISNPAKQLTNKPADDDDDYDFDAI